MRVMVAKETEFGKFNKVTNKRRGDENSSGGGKKEGNEVRNEKRSAKGSKVTGGKNEDSEWLRGKSHLTSAEKDRE